MNSEERQELIAGLVDGRGFLSVADLSASCGVSAITIRRDLSALARQGRVVRTHGGAATTLAPSAAAAVQPPRPKLQAPEEPLLERLQALVVSSPIPAYDRLIRTRYLKRGFVLVAESLCYPNAVTCVAPDNYRAGVEGGQWAGRYVLAHGLKPAQLLDLTYHMANTVERSRGFADGLRSVIPEARTVLSINAQSRQDTAYQVTRDALAVYPGINVIFAINDTTAWGAMHACRDLVLDPEQVVVVTSGLEGDTLRDAIMADSYCRASLAMFPEVIGPLCVEACIQAFRGADLPADLVTPHAILTRDNLPNYYERTAQGWRLRWEQVCRDFALPLPLAPDAPEGRLPRRMGFVMAFTEHEWYQNIARAMAGYCARLGIELEVLDAYQGLPGELDLRQAEIARCAANLIHDDEVVFIDGGPAAVHLAQQLLQRRHITVVTNSLPVIETLMANQEILLIATGGALRHSSQVFVGPTAEAAIREMRADKLFLMAGGVSLDFGLSHTNISEVSIKQTMIQSARQVILLADHTCFDVESLIQVAPLTAVHKIVTDDALPASVRLELGKKGIQVELATM